MRLGAKQELFARLLPKLISQAHRLGYQVRLKEIYRFPEQAKYNSTHCGKCKKTKNAHKRIESHAFRAIGILNSLHCKGLAIDMVLFKDGKPQWSSSSYKKLGVWWENLHELCCWGGRFSDGGHFSLTHGGKK